MEHYTSDITIGAPVSNKQPLQPVLFSSIEDPSGMTAMLLSENSVIENMFFPLPPNGRYESSMLPSLYFEASKGVWKARSGSRIHLMDENRNEVGVIPIQDQRMLYITEHKKQYRLYVDAVNRESNILHNYMVLVNMPIHIGRAEDNGIVCISKFASRHHAELLFTGKTWKLQDCGSTHGTYVNNRRIQKAILNVGDVLTFPGLRLIIGCGFISIADGNRRVSVNTNTIRRVKETSQVFFILCPK